MAVTVVQLRTPFGSDVFFEKSVAKVGYRLTGDGTNGAVNLPFGKLESVISVEADQNHDPQINPTTRIVSLNIPVVASGGLANGDFVDVWLIGKGGH